MRLEFLILSLLSVYSLLSLSINSWFHNLVEIHKFVDEPAWNQKIYGNSFQASFCFDIMIFVWSLFGLLILRKPMPYLPQFFSFYLFLLCLGKIVSTAVFLGNEDVQSMNDVFKQGFDKLNDNNLDVPKELRAWKASYENMIPSVIIELLLSIFCVVCIVRARNGISQQCVKS